MGTAGWSIPTAFKEEFPKGGTHLARYAKRLSGAEINSSFYKPHHPGTYARWAASTPEDFRFAVKIPKEITHKHKLIDAIAPLERFIEESSALAFRLGPLLVQLPPSLTFDESIAERFFTSLRKRFEGSVVCEPRHASWFTAKADLLLETQRIARAAVDPPTVPEAASPGGWTGLTYYRLHGSPRMYYSEYGSDVLARLVRELREASRSSPAWCIFDNTAAGAATGNALSLSAQTAMHI